MIVLTALSHSSVQILRPNPTKLTTATFHLTSSDSLEIHFPFRSGFFLLSPSAFLHVNLAQNCTDFCQWFHAVSPGPYSLPDPGIAEIIPRAPISVNVTAGYRLQRGARVLPGRAELRPLETKRFFEIRAQTTRITRGRYELLAGDYVNVRFSSNNGFLVVSGPVGEYYVNVGSGCKLVDPDDEELDCRWFHTTEHGKYVVMGRSAVTVTAQVVAMEAGVFQLTIGFFDRDCCEWVEALAEGDLHFQRDVSSRASACFIHTAITGTMEVRRVVLSSKALVRAYDYHSMARSIEMSTDGVVIADSDGIGALMLDNTDSASHYNFSFHLDVTDPDATALNLGFLKDYNAEDLWAPATLLGEGRGVLPKDLSPGACVGVECTQNPTRLSGNVDGVRAVGDGDPIYEEIASSSPFIFIGALSLIMLLLVMGVAPVLLCHRRRRARQRLQSQEPQVPEIVPLVGPQILEPIMDPYAVSGKPEATPLDYVTVAQEAPAAETEAHATGVIVDTPPPLFG
jgi:hypothetical protein